MKILFLIFIFGFVLSQTTINIINNNINDKTNCRESKYKEVISLLYKYVTWPNSKKATLFVEGLSNDSVPIDKIFEDNNVKIAVEKKSFLYLAGTILEFSGGLNGKGFVFNNPNAQRTCGCGESFSL